MNADNANETCNHHNSGQCIYSSGFKNVSDKHTFYTKIYITLRIAAQSWSHKSVFLPYNLTLTVSDLAGNVMSRSKFWTVTCIWLDRIKKKLCELKSTNMLLQISQIKNNLPILLHENTKFCIFSGHSVHFTF